MMPQKRTNGNSKVVTTTNPSNQRRNTQEDEERVLQPMLDVDASEMVSVIWRLVSSHIDEHELNFLAAASGAKAIRREIESCLRMAPSFLMREEATFDSDSNECMSEGMDPSPCSIDRQARGTKQIVTKNLFCSLGAIEAPVHDLGYCEAPPAKSNHSPKLQMTTEAIKKLFDSAQEKCGSTITVGELQSFLSLHGHDKLASMGSIREKMNLLDVKISQPLQLADFTRYLESILTDNPYIRFTAVSVQPSPRLHRAKVEALEFRRALHQWKQGSVNGASQASLTSTISHSSKKRRPRADLQRSKHEDRGRVELEVVQANRLDLHLPPPCLAPLHIQCMVRDSHASSNSSKLKEQQPLRKAPASSCRRSQQNFFIPNASIQCPLTANGSIVSLEPGFSVLEERKIGNGKSIINCRSKEPQEFEGHVSRSRYLSSKSSVRSALTSQSQSKITTVETVQPPLYPNSSEGLQSLNFPSINEVAASSCRKKKASSSFSSSKTDIRVPRRSLMESFMAGDVGKNLEPLVGGVKREGLKILLPLCEDRKSCSSASIWNGSHYTEQEQRFTPNFRRPHTSK